MPRIRTREIVTATQFFTTDEQIIEAASELTTLPRGTAMLYVAGQGVSRVNTPLARNPLASTPRFAAKKIAQLRREGLRCPLCQGELVSTGLRGQTTCPHCQAPILLVRSRSRELDSLALPVEFRAFIADSVVARRGKEAILHGWHRSGHPEVVIKLRHQPGDTPPEKTRHPNVVRLLDSGTEVGFDYQVFQWAEGSELNSAAELFTSSERLSPCEAASPKKISPAKTVSAAPVQSEPPDPPQDTDATDIPSIGARWRGRFDQRFHEGLVRGLGIKGLGCSMPMARFLADGVCVSLYAICATMIAFQILGESIAAVAGAIPWLAWQWFWLRHYRRLLGWKTRTAEIIVATLMIALSLMNDAGFWSGVVAAVIVDTWVAAIVVWRTLRCRFGQRFSQLVTPVLQETDKPKPTESEFPQTWLGWIAVSVVMGTVSYWYYDGTKFLVPTKGGKWAVPIKTDHGRQIENERRNAEEQAKKQKSRLRN